MSDLIAPVGTIQRTMSKLATFESSDPDKTRDFVSQIFCAHRFDVLGSDRSFDATISHVQAGRLSFNSFAYGANVSIDPGCLQGFYLLQMVVEGEEILRYGGREFQLHPGLIAVIGPDVSLKKTSPAGTRKIMIKIDRTLLEQACAQHLGHSLRKPLDFQVDLPLNCGRGTGLANLVTFLHDQVSMSESMYRSPLMLANLEHMVTTSLLLSQQSNYFEELNSPVPAISPGFVKRVADYIETYADQPLTVEDLAAYAGVSTRSLFAGFKKYRNTTPMALLRFVRMKRAHVDLIAPKTASVTVTEVALNWGFAHLGRFTAEYKKAFGESPSETLRHARR